MDQYIYWRVNEGWRTAEQMGLGESGDCRAGRHGRVLHDKIVKLCLKSNSGIGVFT